MGVVPTAMPLLTVFATMLRSRHPGLTPTLMAMSSPDIEAQLEDLSLDLALGYTERLGKEGPRLRSWPQTSERYYFLRRRTDPVGTTLSYGPPIKWSEAGKSPLCQLTPDMHNRAIIDSALASVGAPTEPAIVTNSLLAVALAASTGDVCAILPRAMVDAVRGLTELEALPLTEPDIRTPLGFMAIQDDRPSRAVQAALRLMAAPEWAAELEAHAGKG